MRTLRKKQGLTGDVLLLRGENLSGKSPLACSRLRLLMLKKDTDGKPVTTVLRASELMGFLHNFLKGIRESYEIDFQIEAAKMDVADAASAVDLVLAKALKKVDLE